jgi:hypothetical protein
MRVRISHRITLAHWFSFSGRSRYDFIQRLNASPMIVSDVGRMISGSASSAPGSGFSSPSICFRRWCVTTAISLAKPSTCSASLAKNASGISSGK